MISAHVLLPCGKMHPGQDFHYVWVTVQVLKSRISSSQGWAERAKSFPNTRLLNIHANMKMHFPRNLLPRHADGEGWLSPKSPKSPKTPKSPKSPKSLKSLKPLTYTEENIDSLNQCVGCNKVESLIASSLEQYRSGDRPPWTLLHNSFDELERCATRCEICRVFRQSLLLAEVTFEGVQKLRETNGEVIAHWRGTTGTDGRFKPYIALQVEDRPGIIGVVNCSSKNEIDHLALRPYGYDAAVIEQAKKLLDVCLNTHIGQCDNLKYSSENPENLIEILSTDIIRLRKNLPVGIQYVALSYCWGNPAVMTKSENEEVERGKTLTTNLDDRLESLAIASLPTTVRDTLRIIHAMGIRYAWIDTLCVFQDKPDGVATMNKVYANALFTLCACATTRATQKLLDRRDAWTDRTEPCRLGGQWLTTPDMSLNELRLKSPLADRAWTLQEERLSPRMLYISSGRFHWSCASGHEVELKPAYPHGNNGSRRPVHSASDRSAIMPMAQEFLLACRSGEDNLHTFWADIIKSYAARNMTNLNDRLRALSGLAAKYLSADRTDQYLAGIWAKNLPEGLVWKATHAVGDQSEKHGRPVTKWPSWSWAVLPVQTEIETNAASPHSAIFQRIADDNGTVDADMIIESAVEKGETVKEICVYGRVRELWKASSRRVEWSSISKVVNGVEKYTFSMSPEQDMHAIKSESGAILVYEDRKREVIGQLDFRHDVERTQSSSVNLLALEVGETTMLLVERCGDDAYRRVGAAWNVRKDFFALAEPAVLVLR